MGLLEVIIGLVGVVIAVGALMMHRREIKKNSKVNSLLHVSSLLAQRIDFHSKIIESMKLKNETWVGHADKINSELRPLKEQIDSQLIDIAAENISKPSADVIKGLVLKNGNNS